MTERTTILIVDDESKIRRLLSRSLEAEGFDVAVADSAMSASEYLKNGHCDLIILDYMMPEIDGMAFLAELRKKSSIPVIMLSAREEIAKKTPSLGTRGRRLCRQTIFHRRNDGSHPSYPETLRRREDRVGSDRTGS